MLSVASLPSKRKPGGLVLCANCPHKNHRAVCSVDGLFNRQNRHAQYALSVKWDGSDSAVPRKHRPGVLESLAESRISGLNK